MPGYAGAKNLSSGKALLHNHFAQRILNENSDC